MTLEYFVNNRLLPSTFIPEILKEWRTYYEQKAFREYYPELHKVNDPLIRKDKEVVKDAPGGGVDAEGNPITITTYQPVNRISLALQKLIVSRKTAFTTGGTVTLQSKPSNATDEAMLEAVNTVWRNNKLQFRNAEVFKRMASETECAEIWYSRVRTDNTVELKMNIYSPALGYDLIPVFDDNRDLIAFAIRYYIGDNQKKIERLDIYDVDTLTKYSRETNSDWEVIEETPLLYGKIPVIYYGIEQSVWQDVQNMIERLEFLISNFGDTNDYNGSPILLASGEIEGWMDKGETGKVLQSKEGGKLEYVSWDQAPQSIKLEIETLIDMIYTITQTPDISFKAMQGIGDLSGVAFDRIMIDAHLSARDYHNGVYGEGIQRRINFIKSALASIDSSLQSATELEITPNFSLFKIDDEKARIENAKLANGGLAIMSQKESIQYGGFSDDPEATYQQIQAQTEAVTT